MIITATAPSTLIVSPPIVTRPPNATTLALPIREMAPMILAAIALLIVIVFLTLAIQALHLVLPTALVLPHMRIHAPARPKMTAPQPTVHLTTLARACVTRIKVLDLTLMAANALQIPIASQVLVTPQALTSVFPIVKP